jgi:hypothetical protein
MAMHAGLLHESQHSGFHASLDELSFRMHRDEHKLCRGTQLPEFVNCLNSVQNRHADIGHNDVRMEPASFGHQCSTIPCCPHDIEKGRQESNLCFEQSRVVIG